MNDLTRNKNRYMLPFVAVCVCIEQETGGAAEVLAEKLEAKK